MAGQPDDPRGIEREKQVAARAAAEPVEDSMTVRLSTGSTVAFPLPALARRSLEFVCAATSPRTEYAARETTPGVGAHGLFPPETIATVLVAELSQSTGPTSGLRGLVPDLTGPNCRTKLEATWPRQFDCSSPTWTAHW